MKAWTFRASTVTNKLSKLAKVLASPLVATLLVTFSQVSVSAASISSPTAQQSEQSSTKKVRAKRAVKAQKNVLKKADPQPAAAVEPAIQAVVANPEGLALKPSQSVAVEAAQPAPAQVQAPVNPYMPRANPYLVNSQPPLPASSTESSQASSGFKFSKPQIPLFEQSILPKIQTVYPTGEKPLVVVTFKCPTELVGIDTPSTLILHKVVNGGMDVINKTNLLSFNMQQVCQ